MSWFSEQIESRKKNDEAVLKEAYESAMNAVVGESFSFFEAEDAISSIVRYYGLPIVKVPYDEEDDEEKLSAVCRLSGLMKRRVTLNGDWYKNAFGAFLCRLKDGGEYVAVCPDNFGRYHYFDKKKHKRIRLSKSTSGSLSEDAICFYKPLPPKKITVLELIKFGISSWTVTDHLLTYFILLVTTLVGLLTPKLSYFLYSSVVEEGKVSLLVSTMIFIVTVNISLLLLNTIRAIFSERTSTKMSSALKSATMMRALSLSPDFFRNYSSGEMASRMQCVNIVCTSIITMLFSTMMTGLFSLAYISQIFIFAKVLVVPAITIVLANMLFMIYATFRQMKLSKREMEHSAKINGLAVEMISGVQKIKMAGAEKRMFAKYADELSSGVKLQYNPPFFNKFYPVIALAISLLGQLVMYYIAIGARIDAAEYYAFQTSYAMIASAFSAVIAIATQIAELKPGLEMIQPILEAIPENNENAKEITTLNGLIEISNVTFSYDDNEAKVIDGLSLKISPGEYVAIVGKTGCGKSTLIKLLLGFEKPQKGAIYYDGMDISQIEKRSLRQKIGTVMQEDKLFAGDIYSNIVISSPKLKLSDAWEAAEVAGIADDIRNMPMGMFTRISEGSASISGGQRQRIAIARAIAPNPKVLFFDEATSALDNITQRKISNSVDKLNCTRIVIAHRLSTIKNCDRILVMDKGKIIEEGNYSELIEKQGYFASLVNRQRLDN